MRDLVFKNFRVKLASLLSATLLWFTIHLTMPHGAEIVNRVFAGLPIKILVAPDDSHEFRIEPWTVQIELRGDANVIRALREEQVEVFVKLADTDCGAKQVRRRIQVHPPEGTRLVSVDPEEVIVERMSGNPRD